MKTLKKQCEEIINSPINRHLSKEIDNEEKIRRLEGLILKLAQRIDNIEHHVS